MALIVIAADKGAPGVTTTALALAAVWPRPVLLAECDPSGGDLVYRFPAADGSALDPRRGLLTLAVAARRGLQPRQLWEHTQKLSGGLDVLTGVINAEQGASLGALWGPLGDLFAALPGGDVIADCGRLGADGRPYDLLLRASAVLLVTRPNPGDVIRLRDRAAAVTAAANARGRRGLTPAVVVIAEQRTLRATAAEVGLALAHGNVPATVLGGIAADDKGAELMLGQWAGKLDKTMLIRTARETAQQLASSLAGVRDGTGPATAPPGPQTSPSWPQDPATLQQHPAPPRPKQQAPAYPPGQHRGGNGRHAAPPQPAPASAGTGLASTELADPAQPAPVAGPEAGDDPWTTA
jgi:hypothetical protein